jgi:hypothetical protein
LIGVISKPGQRTVVEEFFELFKTPWEFYAPGRAYDVVVATADDVPDVETGCLVIYGAETKPSDARYGITADSRHRGVCLDCEGTLLPIYGELLTFGRGGTAVPCVTSAAGVAGLRVDGADGTVIRLGYDVFDEVQRLLSAGQPVAYAHVPSLDLHIAMLRRWIVDARIPLLEVASAPAGHTFFACLTHDIDFVGIRRHRLDHTMWGFLYRSIVGAIRNFARGRLSLTRLLKTWRAVASLPFVYLGWAKDFWNPFEWYLQVEHNLPTTYYLIPFKRRAGDHVFGRDAARRGTAYDVTDRDLEPWMAALIEAGCELGVHGIDAWHSVDKGREELARVAAITGQSHVGIRMHWLLGDANTPSALERAGYAYDATSGYNETVGYRAGTTQVFRPLGAQTLLELPLHIQDGALFYPQRLDLSEPEAERRCRQLIDRAKTLGGVVTVVWHDRSHGPERFWDDFYINLVQALKSVGARFGTAAQVVTWFRSRREVQFESLEDARGTRIRLRYDGGTIQPPLRIMLHNLVGKTGETDVSWSGEAPVAFDFSRWNSPRRRVWPRASEGETAATAASWNHDPQSIGSRS